MRTPDFWRHRGGISTLLLPLSWLYALGAWVDRACKTPKRAALPVIAIGNATSGGAGKTPTALALLPLLRALTTQPHCITRGYGGQAQVAHRVQAGDDATMVGDEALLLAAHAPCWVGRDRIASIRAAKEAGATLALCDDALQHHALAKDISLLVIDGPYGIGNGRLLPAGPLREPFAAALARADALVMVGEDTQQLAARTTKPVFLATLAPAGDVAWLREGAWLAFAGIGRPEKFFTTLLEAGATLVATRRFADHHAYSDADIANLTSEAERLGAKLITTEKDAVKLPASARQKISTLPVTLQFADSAALQEFLRARLAAS